MSEPGLVAVPPALRDGEESSLSALASLRKQGAQRLDPARFHYMEALARRLHGQPDAVRRILEGKLSDALKDYGERFRQAQEAAGDYGGLRRLGAQAASRPACAPLAELNRYIQSLMRDGVDGRAGCGLSNDGETRAEMKSLRRFREAWSRISAEDQVDQALGRGPENAGPLNSHMLVLRSLALMRKLSPDYLRRFLSQLDTLLWLDQASQRKQPTTPAGESAPVVTRRQRTRARRPPPLSGP